MRFSLVQFSHSVVSDTSHGPQHARPPCPLPTPRVYSNSSLLSQWCHPTISSSVVPFSSCLQSFPASGSFQRSQLFASGGQSIGVSASTGGGGTQQLGETFRPKKKLHEHIYWVSHEQWSSGMHLTSMDVKAQGPADTKEDGHWLQGLRSAFKDRKGSDCVSSERCYEKVERNDVEWKKSVPLLKFRKTSWTGDIQP